MAAYAPQIAEAAESAKRGSGFLTRDEVMTHGRSRSFYGCRPRPSTSWLERACFRPAGSDGHGGSCGRGWRNCSPAKAGLSGSWREDWRQLLPPEVALGPRDLQFAVEVKQHARANKHHADHVAIRVEVDRMTLRGRVGLCRNLGIADAEVQDVGPFVVDVLVEIDSGDREHQLCGRGSDH